MNTSNRVVIFLLLASCLAFGQTPTDQIPKPGPEVQKLDYYVGKWKGEGETKGGPLGPAGKLSSQMTCERFTGGFHVVCRGEETGPTGKRTFLNILSYDQEKKAYTEYSISSFGESEYDQGGSFAEGKLIFILDGDAGGNPSKFRYTEQQMSPDLYTYQTEASISGAPWTMIAEGKITRVK
jgi:hypothetical protein